MIAFTIGPLSKTDAKFYTKRKLAWTKDPVKILGVWFHTDSTKMYQYNYENKIAKAEAIMNVWAKRNITLLGKITVINSLVLSLLMYPMAVMPTPPETFFTKMRQIVTHFIWNGRPPRIKYVKLIQK